MQAQVFFICDLSKILDSWAAVSTGVTFVGNVTSVVHVSKVGVLLQGQSSIDGGLGFTRVNEEV